MHTSVNREALSAALSIAARFAEKRTSIPILSHVHIASNGHLDVSATDQEIGVTVALPCESQVDGAVCLNADTLLKMVKAMKGDTVDMLALPAGVEITAGRSQFAVPSLPAAEYPCLPTAARMSGDGVTIHAGAFVALADRVLYAVSTDETRLNLCGVYLECQSGELTLTATDGDRLVRQSLPVSGELTSGILPKRFVMEVARLAARKGAGDVTLHVCDGIAVAHCGDVTMTARCIDAEFPDYTQVIPSPSERALTVPAASVLASLARVSIVSSERTRGVAFHCGELGAVVVASHDGSTATDAIEGATFAGDAVSVGYNARYLEAPADSLPKGATLRCELKAPFLQNDGDGDGRMIDDGSICPVSISSTDAPGWLAVVMPMRL